MPIRNRHRYAQTPYLQRSRAARKAAYIRAANRIRRAAPILGGKFYTHNFMHGLNSWLDLYFLGRRFPIFYNVAMQTTRHAYKDKVLDEAFRRAELIVPESNTWWEETQIDPDSGLNVAPARSPKRYEELGGLTRYEWIDVRQKVIADEKCIYVNEHWAIQSNYTSGIGLRVTLDVPYLTAQVVNDFIERFLRSPDNYRDPKPLAYTSSEIADWGVEANAIAEPWEWEMIETGAAK